MDIPGRTIQTEPRTLQIVEQPRRNVIQAIELEAERLLEEFFYITDSSCANLC